MLLHGGSSKGQTVLKMAMIALAAVTIFLVAAGTVFAAGPGRKPGKKSQAGIKTSPGAVRIASVSTAVEGGILTALAEKFHAETGLEVKITSTDDPYSSAKKGNADLVIAHFGHRDTERFVQSGFGFWPRMVFSNQLALFGPPADPAKVRGLSDLVQAFRQIAQAKAPYIVNDTRAIRYLTEILWLAAGKPTKDSWYIDNGSSKSNAISLAASRGGYVLWGITPFVREQSEKHPGLEPLVTRDPLLLRIMVSVVVNPRRVRGANSAAALRFQDFLLSPSAQAMMLDIRYPGSTQTIWAPAGRHNAGSLLPDVK